MRRVTVRVKEINHFLQRFQIRDAKEKKKITGGNKAKNTSCLWEGMRGKCIPRP